jgi:hypothetical protein
MGACGAVTPLRRRIVRKDGAARVIFRGCREERGEGTHEKRRKKNAQERQNNAHLRPNSTHYKLPHIPYEGILYM